MSKKSFKAENPALAYIGAAAPAQEPTTQKLRHKAESKSKRLNLLVYPGVYEDLSKVATMKRTSVNDLINTILKEYTEAEADTITKYDSVFSGEGDK